MHPEIESTKKPLLPEAIAPPKESLASQFVQVLEKASETSDVYNLREATKFLNQRAREMGIEAKVSRETLRKWIVVTFAEIIEPIASLPQEKLTAEVFKEKSLEEKALFLSPSSLLAKTGRYPKYSLSIQDLRRILFRAKEAYQNGLNRSYQSAKKTIESFRENCFSLIQISTLLGAGGENSQYNFVEKLNKLLLSEILPLNNYPSILVHAIGIPKEFFEQELRERWQATLALIEKKREEKLSPRQLLQRYPERFTSLNRLLRPLLEAKEINLQNKYIPLLVVYLREKGIKIISYKATAGTYHTLSLEDRGSVKGLLENEEIRNKISQIANQGFTLEEYTQTYRHRFPDKSPIALTEAVRLAGGPVIFSTKSGLETIKELLRKEGIPLEEKTMAQGERKTILNYLPIERFKDAVDILEKANTADPTLFRSIITLEREGKASSLSPLLRQVLPDIKISSMHFPLIYDRNLADIEGIYRIKVRTKRGRDVHSYFFLNAKRQEVIKAFHERENEIAQTIEEAKMSRA